MDESEETKIKTAAEKAAQNVEETVDEIVIAERARQSANETAAKAKSSTAKNAAEFERKAKAAEQRVSDLEDKLGQLLARQVEMEKLVEGLRKTPPKSSEYGSMLDELNDFLNLKIID